MHDNVTYEYTIIRVMPQVERGECFNVGVLLFSKRKKFLDVKYTINETKLKAFSCELDKATLAAYLKSWKLICKGDLQGGPIARLEQPDRFRWLAATRSTIIQSSKTHPGLCFNPETELEYLFEKFVL
ncbi:MAG: DUF3037 domain-containing protein [Aestuariibaculum sp.]